MELSLFNRRTEHEWEIAPHGAMRVPAVIFATEQLIRDMDQKVYEQACNVATLPGVVRAVYAMPDAHWGYGFPIGGVAAFDPNDGGIVSAGGVGYDISCLTDDARVLHAHGFTCRIGDMLGTWQQSSVALHDLDAMTPTRARLSYFFRKRPDTEVYRVQTATGRVVTATSDHPFYTPRGMVPLERINPGDRVAVYPFEGTPYEEPPGETILAEEGFVRFLTGHDKTSRGNALAQLLAQLKRRNLLPLRYDSPALPYLLKLMGFVMGDGTLTRFKDGSAAVAFYAQPDDLEDIRSDLAHLGFRALKVYSRPRTHRIETFYGKHEFSVTEHMTRCGSTALALLLAALGCPMGAKADQPYRVPAWIHRAPRWQKRLFLAAYFGAEMSTPETVSRQNFYCPMVSHSKRIDLIDNAREFLGDLRVLLADLGVATRTISRVSDDYRRKNGERSGRYRLIVSSKPEDLGALYGRIGFVYNRAKMQRGLLIAQYLALKQRALQRRVSVQAEALRLRDQLKLSARAIYEALGSPSDVSVRFVERSVYEGRKTSPRVWDDIESFDEFATSVTEGLGNSGMTWDAVVSKELVVPPDWVYDFTVDHDSHNFIANQFVVSNCGVRCLHTGLNIDEVRAVQKDLADMLYYKIPAGVGSTGTIRLGHDEMDAMLAGGARWARERGFGEHADLERIEEGGRVRDARPECVSDQAKKRQRDEMGTLGSGNHYLEVQQVMQLYDARSAAAFGLHVGDVVISIHCGSRGLGHQIGTEYLRKMAIAAAEHGIRLPDRELACAPINSEVGAQYLGAMRAAINCALANRQILTHLTREAIAQVLPQANVRLLYDVSHNTCKVETHQVDGRPRSLYVHRKGATRAFGPGHPDVPEVFRDVGQPVLIGGSMGTSSFVLAGAEQGEARSFSSACHGAGRAMSRHQAFRTWKGRQVTDELAARGILIRSPSSRGVAEEAPGAYKDVTAVVDAAEQAGLARKVARLQPMICIKG